MFKVKDGLRVGATNVIDGAGNILTTSANALLLGNQPASYYTNATNIASGTLPIAQLPASVFTTANLTFGTGLTFANGVVSALTGASGAAFLNRFVVSNSSVFTMTQSISVPNDIVVTLNGLRLDPTSEYTVSGTTLTVSETIVNGDIVIAERSGGPTGATGSGGGSPPGGTTGQVLAKSSNADYATSWISLGTASLQNIGTSGNTVPLLDGTNTWTNAQTFSSTITASNFTGSSSGTNTGDQTNVTGNAGTATKLATARTFSITGDGVANTTFDGSAKATLDFVLAAVNSNVGSFGSTSAVPIITVNGKGLITAVSTAALGTAAAKNTGTSGNTVPLLDGTNTWSGDQTFANMTVSGNLTISGTTTTVNSTNLNVSDAIITLASNNTTGTVANIGIKAERGTSNDAYMVWNEDTTSFYFQTATDDTLTTTTQVPVRALRFFSGVATGSSPFVVSSTTLVSNLNVELLGGQNSAYYLNAANLTGSLSAARLPAFSGDATTTVGTSALTLATVNSNTGSFGSTAAVPVITVNAKGLITAVSTSALGSAAAKNTGTSGNTVPLLDGANTWSAKQTFSGQVSTAVSTTALAGLNVPHGAAPTTPVNGDLWTQTNGLYGQFNGVTYQLLDSRSRGVSLSGDVTALTTVTLQSGFSLATTLATVNSNVGTFGSTSAVPIITVNGKGLITAVSTAALGTAAVKNTGTSGNAIPLLDGANTWTTKQVFSGQVATTASTTALAGLNIPQGTAPTTPTDGDIWATTNGLYGQFSGGTFKILDNRSRTFALTGDAAGSVIATLDGGVSIATTLATVNTNVGSFGSAAAVPIITVNGKGLITAISTAALGTAATKNTGTSGNTVPLLDGANTWSATQAFASVTVSGTLTRAGNAVYDAGNLTFGSGLTLTNGVLTATGAVNGTRFSPISTTASGSSGQTITLPIAGLTVNDLVVFISGVHQQPTADYTVSGTTLTILDTYPSGENIYIRPQLGQKGDNGNAGPYVNGTGLLLANGTTFSIDPLVVPSLSATQTWTGTQTFGTALATSFSANSVSARASSNLTLSSVNNVNINGLQINLGSSTNVTGTLNATTDLTIAGTSLSTRFSPRKMAINTQTSPYSLVLSDAEGLVRMNSSGPPLFVSIPLNSSVAFPIGTLINIQQAGTSSVVIVGATSGVTIQSDTNWLRLKGQFAMATLIKVDTDTWALAGALVA